MEYEGNVSALYLNKGYGRSNEEEKRIKERIEKSVRNFCNDIKISTIDFYNAGGKKHNYTAGNKERMIVICDTTSSSVAEEKAIYEDGLVFSGKETRFKSCFVPKATGIVILSENGYAVAEYFTDINQVNILFDLFELNDDDMCVALEYLVKAINAAYKDYFEKEKMWNVEGNKTRLLKVFEEAVLLQKREQTRRDENALRGYVDEVERYKRGIVTAERKRVALMTSIEAAQAVDTNSMSMVEKDFNLIIEHKKIENLLLDGKKVIVQTMPLYITSDKGKRYYGGKYKIEINMENSDVLFYGDNPRRSYWSKNDPHPHVSGKSGHACLGNVAETIAELCAGFQVYALVMICIDFLEAANTSDVAGKKVVNWDEVDENNNPIAAKKSNLKQCSCCHEEFDDDDLYEVYEGVEDDGDGEPRAHGLHYVCDECREENYYLNEDVDEYIRD